jgi:hypothetical protein
MTGHVNNPNYLLELNSHNPDFKLIANLPEAFSLSSSSDYESWLPSSLREALDQSGLGGVKPVTAAYNYNFIQQVNTHQVWVSSTPIEFSLTALFDAQTDARVDVFEPMIGLQKLALPYKKDDTDGRQLWAPGPSVFDKDKGRISLRIGRMMYFHSVVLTSVNNTFDTKLDINGFPISGQSDLSFRNIVLSSREDLDEYIGKAQGESE